MRVSIMIAILLAHGVMSAMDEKDNGALPVFGELLRRLSHHLGSAAPSIVHSVSPYTNGCIKSPSAQTLQEHCAEHVADRLDAIHQSKPGILSAAAQAGALALVCGAGIGSLLSDMIPGVEFIIPGVAVVGGALWGAAQAIQEREQMAKGEGYIQGVADAAGIQTAVQELMQKAAHRMQVAHGNTR